jgi:hypothetical protein
LVPRGKSPAGRRDGRTRLFVGTEVRGAGPRVGKEGKQEPVIAKVSQETLADIIGTRRSRVSHFMNKFRQLGYIAYNGDLEVHSSLLDAVLHEKPQIKMPG